MNITRVLSPGAFAVCSAAVASSALRAQGQAHAFGFPIEK